MTDATKPPEPDPMDTDTEEIGCTFWALMKSDHPIPGADLYGSPPGDDSAFFYRIARITQNAPA